MKKIYLILFLGICFVANGAHATSAHAVEKPRIETKTGPCKTKDGKTLNTGEPGYDECVKVGLTIEAKPKPKPKPDPEKPAAGGSEGIGIIVTPK